MAMFDFLKVAVEKPKPEAKFTATVQIAGTMHPVNNLGPQSFTAANAGKYRQGQTISFDLIMKDPKGTVSVKGTGSVAAVEKGEAKVSLKLAQLAGDGGNRQPQMLRRHPQTALPGDKLKGAQALEVECVEIEHGGAFLSGAR